MKKYLCYLIIFLIGPCLLVADTGTTGGDFLKVTPHARYKAMGESVVADTSDANSLFYNPAGLAEIITREIWLSHVEYIADFRYESITLAQPFSFGSLAFNASYFYMKPFDDIDISGNTQGELKANDMLINIGYARKILDISQFSLSLGGGVKYISSTLHTYKASTIACDLGILFRTTLFKFIKEGSAQNFQAGISMQNLGGKLQYGNESTSLPLKIRGGIAYHAYTWKQHGVLITSEIKYTSEAEVIPSFGLEYAYYKALFLRAGYIISDALYSYSLGLGGSYKLKGMKLFLDLAFVPYDVLDNVYNVSLGIKF